MNKKFIFLIIGMFLLSLTFVSAESIGTFKTNESFQITNYCNSGDCSFMNLTSITYPNGSILYLNKEMTAMEQEFNYTFSSNMSGEYSFKTCADPGGLLTCESDTFRLTISGNEGTTPQLFSRIFLVILFGSLFFIVAYLKNKIDFERWYKNMLKKHEKRNFVKLTFSIIGYNIMKNVYILYYLIGFVLMTLIYNIAFLYNLEVILPIFKILMFIYSWSVILIGLVLIGNIQEWAMNWMKDLEDNNWGMGK